MPPESDGQPKILADMRNTVDWYSQLADNPSLLAKVDIQDPPRRLAFWLEGIVWNVDECRHLFEQIASEVVGYRADCEDDGLPYKPSQARAVCAGVISSLDDTMSTFEQLLPKVVKIVEGIHKYLDGLESVAAAKVFETKLHKLLIQANGELKTNRYPLDFDSAFHDAYGCVRKWDVLVKKISERYVLPLAGMVTDLKSQPVFDETDQARATADAEPPQSNAHGESAEDIQLPPRAVKARDQYLKAAESLGTDSPKDREAYDLLEKVYRQKGKGDELPQFDTWQRNLRLWRNPTNQQKNKPRSDGRAEEARSVVLQSAR